MKSLHEITMSRFVDLLCGDDSALEPKGASDEEIGKAKAKIVYEFTRLSDPAAASRALSEASAQLKRRASLTLLRMCLNLAEIGFADDAKSILAEYGIRRVSSGADAMKAEIKAMMKRIERDMDVEAAEKGRAQTPGEIREGYERQCASLMAHFKFQIDMSTIKASQYACLAAQAVSEIKAKQAAMAKIK